MDKLGISILTIYASKKIKQLYKTLLSFKKFTQNINQFVIVGGEKSQTSTIKKFISENFHEQDFNKFKLFIENDLGVSHAFNKGIFGADFSHILFCNAGDELIFIPKINFENQIIMPQLIQEKKSGLNKLIIPDIKNINFPNKYVHPGSIVSKKCFIKVGIFNLRYKVSMDYDFFCRAYNKLVPITSIDKPIVKMEPSFLSGSNISPRQFYEPIEIGLRFCPLQVLRNLPLYLIIYFIRLLKVKNLLKTLDNLK
jgi:hypothetical protein